MVIQFDLWNITPNNGDYDWDPSSIYSRTWTWE